MNRLALFASSALLCTASVAYAAPAPAPVLSTSSSPPHHHHTHVAAKAVTAPHHVAGKQSAPAATRMAEAAKAKHRAHHAVAHAVAKAAPVAAAAAVVAAAAPKPAPPAVDASKGTDSGLPLPRFAALRSDQVSLRAGPGTRYPIDWVYQRRYLPVKIEREFEVWRLVSEPDGTKGWVHEAMLTGRRGFLIDGDQPQTLRAAAADTAAAVAILKPGVVGRLLNCPPPGSWCRVEVKTYAGWLPRTAFWGTLPDETIAQ